MLKSRLYATAAFSVARLVAFMPHDEADVVVVEGADGNPVRMNRADFDADQAEDGAKQYKLHTDHEQYNSNGEFIGDGPAPGTQSADDAKGNMINNPENQNTQSLVGEDRLRADRIAALNFGVVQEKKRFYIVDANNDGKRIDDLDGIDAKGYKSNKEAWDAVFKVKTEAANIAPVADANADADAADEADTDGEESDNEDTAK